MESKNTQQSSEKSEGSAKTKNPSKATKTTQSQSGSGKKKSEKVSTALKSLTSTDVVTRCCERVGMPLLSTELAVQLAEDAEHRLREMIELAKQFMLHSSRTKLAVEDITRACTHGNAEMDTLPLSVTYLESTQDGDVDLEAVVSKDERLNTTKEGGTTCSWLVLEGNVMDNKKNRGMQVSTTLSGKTGKNRESLNTFIISLFSEDNETRDFALTQLATAGWVSSILVELVHTLCDVIRRENAGKLRLLALEAVKSISVNKLVFIDAHLLMLNATLKSVIFIEKPTHFKPGRELLQRNALVILIRLLKQHASPYNGLEGQLEREASRLINNNKTHPVNLYAALLIASNSTKDMIGECVIPRLDALFSTCTRLLTDKHTQMSVYLPLLILQKLSEAVAHYISSDIVRDDVPQLYLDQFDRFGEVFLFQCNSYKLKEPYTKQVAKKKSTQVFTGVGKIDEKDLEKLMYLTNLPAPEDTPANSKNLPLMVSDSRPRYRFKEGDKIQFTIKTITNNVTPKVDLENAKQRETVVKDFKSRFVSQSKFDICNDLRIIF